MDRMAWRSLRAASRIILAQKVDVQVEGVDKVPEQGPVIVAARHYHHLYDGCAVLAAIPREAHIVVGLDWVKPGLGARVMQRACRAARWPVVDRAGDRWQRASALRRAQDDVLALLREGRVVLMFPEGYPVVDPEPSPRGEGVDLLPFQAGVAYVARAAARDGLRVPVAPAGITFGEGERRRMTLRFGEPVLAGADASIADVTREIEERVRGLSGLSGQGGD